MIVIDASEANGRTLLPEIAGAKVSPVLERETGADMMISPFSLPATTPQLLQKHLEGSLFVQGKWSFDDLEASIMDGRLMGSLARMVSFGVPSAARILLYVGEPLPVGSREWAALSKFQDRGGRVETVESWGDIVKWAKIKESHVAEYQQRPILWSFTEYETAIDNGMLQLPIEVAKDDPRRAVMQCPGIGAELANRWWEVLKAHRPGTASLFDLLAWMSWEDAAAVPKVDGYGSGKRQAVRDWLGLGKGYNLHMKGEQ